MNEQPRSRAPLIVAIVLLLLPVLYVGSYFALVRPRGVQVQFILDGNLETGYEIDSHYQGCRGLCDVLYWPLEQIDRNLRPGAWERSLELRKLDSEAKTRNRSGILQEVSN